MCGSELEQAKAEHAREVVALKDQHKMEMDALWAELTRVSEAVLEPEQKPEQKLAKADQEARAALLDGM